MTPCPIIAELRALRERKGISQRQLSERAGYASEAVHTWETGQRTPSFKALHDWCAALGVRLTIVLK